MSLALQRAGAAPAASVELPQPISTSMPSRAQQRSTSALIVGPGRIHALYYR